jgi:aerobic C4-dicarboxylate transport protein
MPSATGSAYDSRANGGEGKLDAAPPRTAIYKLLYAQVLAAIVIGAALGYYAPGLAQRMQPLGDAFIRAIRMVIGPLIFCTVVHGIAGMDDLKRAGRVALKAIVYFEAVTTLALIIGLLVVNIWKPGAGMNVDVTSLDASAVASYTTQARQQGIIPFLLHVIPQTVAGAFAEGEILQVLFVSVLFGVALFQLGERGRPLVKLIDVLSKAIFGIVSIIMKAAPVGAFGAMAFTVGRYGVGSLLPLAKLMACFYATCLLFVFGVLGVVAWRAGFSIWRLITFIKEEILIVLGTSSSEPALPGLIAKLEDLGCAESVTGLVVPTGYSFNLDGTCIYLVMATVFLAQATNTPLPVSQQLTLLGVLLLTSKGAAGVAGAALIVLAATLSSIGTIPVSSITLILGIHRFMGEAISITNLIGNAVATVVVSKWDGALDSERMARRLDPSRRVKAAVA